MAVIVPEKGQSKAVAQRLLDLAAVPGEVQTTTDGPDGVSFVVPDDLYDAYIGSDKETEQSPAVEVVDEGLPAPKRRGRPPGSKNKAQNTKTEE